MPNADLRRGQLRGRYFARSCAPLIWHSRSRAADYIRCHVRGRHSMLESTRSTAGLDAIANLAWRCNGDRLNCNRHELRWFVPAVLTKIADEQSGAPEPKRRLEFYTKSRLLAPFRPGDRQRSSFNVVRYPKGNRCVTAKPLPLYSLSRRTGPGE